MKRSFVALAVSALVLALAAPSGALASNPRPVSAAAQQGPKLVWDGDFPDPGMAKLGNSYYLFQTGRGFKNTASANPTGPYGARKTSLSEEAPWMTADGQGSWAPSVFPVKGDDGKTRYVMYFTAYHETRKTPCIGVARSWVPRERYEYLPGSTICAPTSGYEAIDAVNYKSGNGTRWLVYKASLRNEQDWQIRAVKMNKYGTLPAKPRTDIRLTTRAQVTRPMEAPSLVRHGGKVWMFTSRGIYDRGCDYHTDVWKADTFAPRKFKRVKSVMTTDSTGLCGPGGAHVMLVDGRTYIAFHAWRDKEHTRGERRAYVGRLGWNSAGSPYLLR